MKLAEYPYLSKMDERKLTFLQINICGLSEHSKIALNHYVHEKDPDVVFLNETKANLPWQFLNNYNAISEHKHGLGGVAILLKEEIAYATVRNRGDLSRQHSVNNGVKWFAIGRFNSLCTTRELRWSQEDNEGFGKL